MSVRLQKIISEAGITSRRGAEALIVSGKVRVNGKVVTELGSKADITKDVITVNGKKIEPSYKKVYLMMNKPTRCMTTLKDPQGRTIVTDLIKGVEERVYPVGRLDYDTSGILILTNDGDVANRLMHPRHEVKKTYRAKVRGILTEAQLNNLKRENLKLGFRAPHKVSVEPVKRSPARRSLTNNSWIIITISEGKNRQVRRMIESVGGTVLKLERVAYGRLELKGLRVGEVRHLSEDEVKYLKSL